MRLTFFLQSFKNVWSDSFVVALSFMRFIALERVLRNLTKPYLKKMRISKITRLR